MNSLNELFDEVLHREALPTTEERRHAVAEVAVRGARRRRRVHATVQIVAVVAVVGLGAAAGSVMLGHDAAEPSEPTPAPSTPAPSPVGQSSIHPSMPEAPPMTDAQWEAYDGTWDVELAASANGSSASGSSSVAIYASPPGGNRALAYASRDFPMSDPTILGLDASSRMAVIYSDARQELAFVDLRDPRVTPAQLSDPSLTMSSAQSMGRTIDGQDVFYIELVDDKGSYTYSVFRLDDGAAYGVATLDTVPSSLWANSFATTTADKILIHQVFGSNTTSIAAQDCNVDAWTTRGTLWVWCGSGDLNVENFEVDPATGSMKPSPNDGDIWVAIDRIRSWRLFEDHSLVDGAPVIDNGDGTFSNLAEGFLGKPDVYSAIFGIREP